jgi:hypothetical protein
MDQITIIGKTDWRNQQQLFGIKDPDRLGHIYCIGKTGTGKSTLLMNMAISDIERGNGICIIDPHGDIAENILRHVPQSRMNDVIYFNATDPDFPIGFNPLHGVHPNEYDLVCSNLVATFKKIWSESWGPRLEHILRFSILSLLRFPPATLLDIQPLLTDPQFRKKVLGYVSDISIQNFWNNEFEKYPPQFRNEAIAPVLNKTGVLLASRPLKNIIGQQTRSFRMQEVLDRKKILICNLSKGIIGEEASSLLGSIILTAIQSATTFRATQNEERRTPFYLYVDEVHSFITLSFADMLSESRKFGLSLFLTHQYIEQLDEKIRKAIFGNVGTLISFRVGAEDAQFLENEFYPVFKTNDLISLPRHSIYIKLMIDGATSKPFSAVTNPTKKINQSNKKQIIFLSQQNYGRPKSNVEKEISSKFENQKKEQQPTLFVE